MPEIVAQIEVGTIHVNALKQSLPEIYHSLISPSVLNLKIHETKATCDNCLRARDQRFQYLYKNNLKCCTFFPFLPNYAVGGILAENLPGAELIKKQISAREMTLPLGLFPTPQYQYDFFNKGKKDFGRREDLLCPYYDKTQDNCQIWKYRGVVCTTFFCSSSYGQKGKLFWSELSDYLSFVEMALAEDNLVCLDFSPREISDQLQFLNMKQWSESQKTQRSLEKKEYKRFWNGYDSEIDFYLKCFELVRNQDRQYFSGLLGSAGVQLEKMVFKAGKVLGAT